MRSRPICLLPLLCIAAPAAARDGELHSFHCLHGCPQGAAATNDTIVREIYTLSSNDLTKMADWVAYRVTPETIGPSEGRQWAADPWLAPEETLTPDSYEGAPAALRIDRGHQAPLASFSGTAHADDTNILSNITPQSAALNQGPWKKIEDAERALVQRTRGPLYVMTGPLFERPMRPMPNADPRHRVPSGYWKIVAAPDGRMSAFIFEQTGRRRDDPCQARTTLLTVELRSRLTLFPMTDPARFTSLDADLGCTAPPPPPTPPSEIPAN